MTPIPMSAEECVMFLSRVYSDLSVADDFIGTTGEQIMQAKGRHALASHTAWLMERMPKEKEDGWDRTTRDYVQGNNNALHDFCTVLQAEIDSLTKEL